MLMNILNTSIVLRSQHNSPAFQAHQGDSDDSEEEVVNCYFTTLRVLQFYLCCTPQVISGIFGKKTFGPKRMKEESIDNAFLLT